MFLSRRFLSQIAMFCHHTLIFCLVVWYCLTVCINVVCLCTCHAQTALSNLHLQLFIFPGRYSTLAKIKFNLLTIKEPKHVPIFKFIGNNAVFFILVTGKAAHVIDSWHVKGDKIRQHWGCSAFLSTSEMSGAWDSWFK